MRPHHPGDGLDQAVTGQEGVILVAQLLHKLLVLVQFLEVLQVEVRDIELSGLLLMVGIPNHAHAVPGASHSGELHTARETLVLLSVVVLQVDLQNETTR